MPVRAQSHTRKSGEFRRYGAQQRRKLFQPGDSMLVFVLMLPVRPSRLVHGGECFGNRSRHLRFQEVRKEYVWNRAVLPILHGEARQVRIHL
jgi:hypothetical protein